MEFFPPKYSMLSHLGLGDFAQPTKIKDIIIQINKAVKGSYEYSFASDDWCIVKILGNKSTVSNGFNEFESFELKTSFVVNLLEDWLKFLMKYERNEIPVIDEGHFIREFPNAFIQFFLFLETNGFTRTRLYPESNLFYKFEYSMEKVTIEFIYELREDIFDATIEKNDGPANKHSLYDCILRYEPNITRLQLQPTIGNWYEPLKLFATVLERHLKKIIKDVESNYIA